MKWIKCHLRKIVYINGNIISLFLEGLIVVIAITKLGYLDDDRTQMFQSIVKVEDANLFAVESLRSYETQKNEAHLDFAYKHLKTAGDELLKLKGFNHALCKTPKGYWTVKPIDNSPLNQLSEQDIFESMKLTDGSDCDRTGTDIGILGLTILKDIVSNYTEWLIAILGMILLAIKYISLKFEQRFEAKRHNEKNLANYLAGN